MEEMGNLGNESFKEFLARCLALGKPAKQLDFPSLYLYQIAAESSP